MDTPKDREALTRPMASTTNLNCTAPSPHRTNRIYAVCTLCNSALPYSAQRGLRNRYCVLTVTLTDKTGAIRRFLCDLLPLFGFRFIVCVKVKIGDNFCISVCGYVVASLLCIFIIPYGVSEIWVLLCLLRIII